MASCRAGHGWSALTSSMASTAAMQLAFDLCGGLGRRARGDGRDAACVRGSPHGLDSCAVPLPSASPRLAALAPALSASWGACAAWSTALASCQGLRGFGQVLLRVSPALAHCERITLHHLMGDMEEIGHAQAFQALFRKLDPGLGAVTDQIPHLGAQGLEPLLDHAFHVV